MILSLIFNNPLLAMVWAAAVLVALATHEFSHALAAKLLGDDTPEEQGRLTLNPFAHVDPIGLAMLLFVGFGWGRPVVFDVRRLRNQTVGPALVGIAGPLSNLLSALVLALATRWLLLFGGFNSDNLMIQFFILLILFNTTLLVFNLLPIPPLDGSHVLLSILPNQYWKLKIWLVTRGPMLMIGLVFVDMLSGGRLLGPLFHFFQDLVFRLIG